MNKQAFLAGYRSAGFRKRAAVKVPGGAVSLLRRLPGLGGGTLRGYLKRMLLEPPAYFGEAGKLDTLGSYGVDMASKAAGAAGAAMVVGGVPVLGGLYGLGYGVDALGKKLSGAR